MNLKRFDLDIFYDSPTRTYCSKGESLDCEDLIDWINHQQYVLELSKEEVLDKLMRELS